MLRILLFAACVMSTPPVDGAARLEPVFWELWEPDEPWEWWQLEEEVPEPAHEGDHEPAER